MHGDTLFLNDIPSPFNLPRPRRWWAQVLADFDPDLRIFPSQKQPVYRVMRLARLSGGLNLDRFRHLLHALNPDTRIALERHLVPVMTFGPDVFNRHPSLIVAALRRRDTWALAPGGDANDRGDAAADALDQMEADAQAAIDRRIKDENRQRQKAMALAYRYRTGSRVSLVTPRKRPSSTPVGRSADQPSPAGA